MSHVTDVVILIDAGQFHTDNDDVSLPLIDEINDWLKTEMNYTSSFLIRLDSKIKSPKVFQAYLFAGAFNYLNIEEFLKFCYSLSWPEKEKIQFMIKDEHEEFFTLLDMKNEKKIKEYYEQF